MADGAGAPGPAANPVFIGTSLLPGEAKRVEIQPLWIVLAMPLAAALGGVAAATAGTEIPRIAGSTRLIVWVLALFLVARACVAVVNWIYYRVIITDERLLILSGISPRKIRSYPLPELGDISYYLPLRGRGSRRSYGTIIIRLADGAELTLEFIPYIKQIYLTIGNMVSGQTQDQDQDSAD
jgi:hypothetical protein